MWLFACLFFLIILQVNGSELTLNVKEQFDQHGIITDMLNSAPEEFIQVSYPTGQVILGNELTPNQARGEPRVSWPNDPTKMYTLIMIDPDAPSYDNPKFREWLHWLIVNIPGNKISSGEILADYRGPQPPKRTGFHRYVFLVYEQKQKINTKDQTIISRESISGRAGFRVNIFAKKNKLGNPIAGNFYFAQNQE